MIVQLFEALADQHGGVVNDVSARGIAWSVSWEDRSSYVRFRKVSTRPTVHNRRGLGTR